MATETGQPTTQKPRSAARQASIDNLARAGTLKRQRKMLADKMLPKMDSLPPEVWTPALLGELGRILQAKLPDHVKVDIRQVG